MFPVAKQMRDEGTLGGIVIGLDSKIRAVPKEPTVK